MKTYDLLKLQERDRGSSYLELLLVLPLLLLVAFACFEYSQYLNQLQLATSLSREIANVGYRQCLMNADWLASANNSRGTEVSDCLLKTQNSLLQNQTINDSLEHSQIILSVYSYDTATTSVISQGSVVRRPQCRAGSRYCSSRYSANAFENTNELREAIEAYGTVVTAEVITPFDSFISSSIGILGFLPEVIYGTTIL